MHLARAGLRAGACCPCNRPFTPTFFARLPCIRRYIGTIAFAYICFVMFILFCFALVVFQSAVSEELGIGESAVFFVKHAGR